MNAIDTIVYKGFEIKVYQEDCPGSPREWDNLGTMYCNHPRYNLGDEQVENLDDFFIKTISEFLPDSDTLNLCSGWCDVVEAGNIDHYNQVLNRHFIALPLYLYDHSGLNLTTYEANGHHWQWDTSFVGYIVVSKKAVREEYGWKNITQKRAARIETYLKNEVEIYSSYLNGSVYGYQVEDNEGESLDSCWGYYGYDHKESGLLESAQSAIDYHLAHLPEPVEAEPEPIEFELEISEPEPVYLTV